MQQDNGAHILDVNVGLPDIDEPAVMVEAIREIQEKRQKEKENSSDKEQ